MTEATKTETTEAAAKGATDKEAMKGVVNQALVSMLLLEAEGIAARAALLARKAAAVRDAVGPAGETPKEMNVKAARFDLRSPKLIAGVGVVLLMPWVVGLWTLGRALMGAL